MEVVPSVSLIVSRSLDIDDQKKATKIHLHRSLSLGDSDDVNLCDIKDQPIIVPVTNSKEVVEQTTKFFLPSQKSSAEDELFPPRIQKLRKDIQHLTQLKRKKTYSPETENFKKSQSCPQLTKQPKPESTIAQFDNPAFEKDGPFPGRRLTSLSDVVQSLLHEPVKEDIHPFGRGNIYKSLYDTERRKPNHEDGKLFMWLLAVLLVLGLAGSVIVMSLMYRPVEYHPLNDTESNSFSPSE